MTKRSTFGPVYSAPLDGARIQTQMENLLALMLFESKHDCWRTLGEISRAYATLYPFARACPEASASAQLRHLRKAAFGGYIVEKRRRDNGASHVPGKGSVGDQYGVGTWEYKVSPPPTAAQLGQQELFGGIHAQQ